VPNAPDSYVHRIGRTARAGATGIAISLCDHEEMAYLRDIERLIRMTIPVTDQRTEQQRAAKPAGAHSPENHRQASRNKRRRPRGGGGSGGGYKGQTAHGGNAENRNHQGRERGPQHAASQPSTRHEGNDMSAVGFLREPRRGQHQPRRQREPSQA
jgi:ATP-dependent RNA helicase RhlE